jgi:flagellar biosynthesis protein
MIEKEKKDVLKKAVALKYQMYEDNAPHVVAKGQGYIADKIIEIAKQNNIPIQEDTDLIAILSKIEIMQEIPMELYKVVAEILAYVYRMNKKSINFRTT